jgi:hypothetical protein
MTCQFSGGAPGFLVRRLGCPSLLNRLTQGGYAFRIIPHKKKEGLINGVLWIDGATGMAVRLSGYLVKNPSIFLKRVNLTRENFLCDGIVETRTTHLLIDTRLVGSARLVVVERPTGFLENSPPVP